MSRETRDSSSYGYRLLDGEPTPKFRSIARETDEDVRAVLNCKMTNHQRIESLSEIVRAKNRIIDRLKEELSDLNQMYEKVYKECQQIKFQQRGFVGARGRVPVGERTRSLDVALPGEKCMLSETPIKKNTLEKKTIEKYPVGREEGSLGTTIPARPRSKCSSIDSNSLNLSSIKPHPQNNDSVYKPLETSPQFAKNIKCDQSFDTLKPLLSFLKRRYPEVYDESHFLPHLRYDLERLDKNSNFFGVLYRAATELTPEKEAASLSSEPKELWRWLKWFFKQYMALREQLSDQSRLKLLEFRDDERKLAKDLQELIDCVEAPDLEAAKSSILVLKQNSQYCRQLAYKVSAIFGLKQISPQTVLSSLDKLHFTLEKEREMSEASC